MVKMENIAHAIEQFAPLHLAGSWDNVGLILGDRDKAVQRVLLTLDIDMEVAKEAAALQADAVISHHPLIFSPLKQINSDTSQGRCILYLLQKGIALYSAHTNLDAARGGLNDYLTDLYDMQDTSATDIVYTDESGSEYGLSRVGRLPREMRLQELARYIADKLHVDSVTFAGDPDAPVLRAAICSGGGGSKISPALAELADVYITGDVKYSGARDAADMGLAVIVAGHYDTEIFCMDIFERILSSLPVEIHRSAANQNIFKTIMI